jgi:hypothetical protein
MIGLDTSLFGTHSLRRTKATLIYRKTGNLRAVQLLLGHTKVESTVRYLGIEVDDALAIAEQGTSKKWDGARNCYIRAYPDLRIRPRAEFEHLELTAATPSKAVVTE